MLQDIVLKYQSWSPYQRKRKQKRGQGGGEHLQMDLHAYGMIAHVALEEVWTFVVSSMVMFYSYMWDTHSSALMIQPFHMAVLGSFSGFKDLTTQVWHWYAVVHIFRCDVLRQSGCAMWALTVSVNDNLFFLLFFCLKLALICLIIVSSTSFNFVIISTRLHFSNRMQDPHPDVLPLHQFRLREIVWDLVCGKRFNGLNLIVKYKR